jgi:hypothetical protein
MRVQFAQLPLHPHPAHGGDATANSRPPIQSIVASGSLDAAGRLELEYMLHGDLQRIRIPTGSGAPARTPARRDELWRHTCLELFARADGSPHYLELNFALDGDWAAYLFDGYRTARRNAEASDCIVRTLAQGAELRARISARVPALAGTDRVHTWHLGVAAIVENVDGALSYWALQHPRAQADFHDPAGFSCALGAPAL